MNIYEKIQTVKQQLKALNLKKTGKNNYSGFMYYELADFLPAIIDLCTQNKLFTAITFSAELGQLKIINSENPEENLIYCSPIDELELKGCNKIQALGGTQTYLRRYLYMNAFDIVEADSFDAVAGKEDKEDKTIKKEEVKQPSADDKMITPEHRKDLVKTKEGLELLNKHNGKVPYSVYIEFMKG